MIDDDGSEPKLVTLSISNTTDRICYFDREWIVVEAKVGNHWMKQPNQVGLGFLNPGGTKDLLLLLQSRAESCRLHLKYGNQSLIARAVERLWRAGVRTPFSFNRWIYSLPEKTHSRSVTLEIQLPSSAIQAPSAMAISRFCSAA
jgi:hypothetical protein